VTHKPDELLEHDADGIKEFDNALPLWWLYGFYFTILFAAVYLVNYHVLPQPLFGAKGIVAEYEAEMRAAGSRQPGAGPGPEGGGPPAVLVPLVAAADLERGRAIFESQTHPCAACHRADLGGLVGPNLTDEGWLHGCSVGELVNDLRVGFPARGMLPYGGGPALSDTELLQLSSYVLSRRGSQPPNPRPGDAARDKPCLPGGPADPK
jgi:cytochrome c oxidase cbb3-type subunit 3